MWIAAGRDGCCDDDDMHRLEDVTRAPKALLMTALLAPVGGLLIALAAYRSSASEDIGLVLTQWYFYLSVGFVLLAGAANFVLLHWRRRHPVQSTH
jgi:hypothetical protein